MNDARNKAIALAELGLPVFKVRLADDGSKTPMHPNGHLDATLDPGLADDWFSESPNALVGVYMGGAGLLAVDVDVKNGKDGWESLERAWLEVPPTFSYDTPSGGQHLIYAAPEGVDLAPSSNYRKMPGVDIRAGSSWVLWNGPAPASREVFSAAPEWACDPVTVRSAEGFKGEVQEWFAGLEPGSPSLFVRKAIERVEPDMSHGDMVAATYEAIRLGAEGHPGIPELLSTLEDAWMSRDPGNHTTPEEKWEWKFHEALAGGIAKHGAAISLRQDLPEYNLADVPNSVPTHLISGVPGGKDVFRDLLRELQASTDDDLLVTSILWNSPRTRDISREWGLEFVHERVMSAREIPEPVRENPTLPDTPVPTPDRTDDEPRHKDSQGGTILTEEEAALVARTTTFIDRYVEASAQKGFSVPAYDIPGAWTALSMAVGPRAVTAYNGVGVNLWFISMGGTGSGKTTSQKFLRAVMDLLLRDGDGYYNVGASSSPAAIHEELLTRDGKASMIFHDEAASFFSDLNNTEWMKTLEHHFSAFYDGDVEPSNKVRLPKELRGKHARTSFNMNMSATPDKLLSLVTSGMFESGFLSRVNWAWAPDRENTEERFKMRPSTVDANTRAHPVTFDLIADLKSLQATLPDRVVVGGAEFAWDRLSEAFQGFDEMARKEEQYEILKGPLTRLSETMVKCASLLALYRGDHEFSFADAVIAVYYAEGWYETMVRVVSETSESEFSRDVNEIEAFIRANKGSVTETSLMHRFRTMVRKSPRELMDRVEFLRMSGRINRVERDKVIVFELNGG